MSVLTPTQLAQFTLSSGALNDTEKINKVFDQLEEGDALKNVDDFLMQLREDDEEVGYSLSLGKAYFCALNWPKSQVVYCGYRPSLIVEGSEQIKRHT